MLRKFRVNVNGKEYYVELEEIGGAEGQSQVAPVALAPAPVALAPAPVAVTPVPVVAPAPVAVTPAPPVAPAPVAPPAPSNDDIVIEAPMPGNIISVLVNVGDAVAVDQALVVLEAMKMENELVAPKAGVVKAIHVTAGSAIDVGKPIITIG